MGATDFTGQKDYSLTCSDQIHSLITSLYLTNSMELEVKMQTALPGAEGNRVSGIDNAL
ncbi:MAG: hypothetical protein HAW67_04800 [Endozoicomonadaceae bacterium]|nr:hypothetical protein [Endozoicomonadaceae bacterium]